MNNSDPAVARGSLAHCHSEMVRVAAPETRSAVADGRQWHLPQRHHYSGMRVLRCRLGHEGAGIVEHRRGGTHVRVGDHVVINWQAKCNRCRHCLAGRQDLCENIQSTAAPRVFRGDTPLAVMLNAGTFCPLAVVPAGGAVPVRKDIPLAKAAMLGCAVAWRRCCPLHRAYSSGR